MNNLDSDVMTRVTNALLGNLAWKGILDVRCRNGIVRLEGIATSEKSRKAAEAIASQQWGVTAVVNKLHVWTVKKSQLERNGNLDRGRNV